MEGNEKATVTSSEYEAKVLAMLGDPKEVDRELRAFENDAKLMSSRHQHLISQYPNQWVGIFGGKVAATGRTLDSVIAELQSAGIPRGRAIVRYISKNPRKMFL